MKAVLWKKFLAVISYMKKKFECISLNAVTQTSKNKRKKIKPYVKRRAEIAKNAAQINAVETKKTRRWSNGLKSWLFQWKSAMYEPSAKLTKKRNQNILIHATSNESMNSLNILWKYRWSSIHTLKTFTHSIENTKSDRFLELHEILKLYQDQE